MRSWRCGLFFIWLITLVGCSASQHADMIFPDDDWVVATPESQNVDGELLDQAMQTLASLGKDRGEIKHTGHARSLVIRNGRLIWAGTDIDTLTPVYSCTKSLTSSVFGLLVDAGKCTPDTLAAEVYPALEEHYPTATLGHFASLTSGYSVPWKQPWSEIRPPDFAPGAMMHYNSAGHMLAYMFQRLAGESMADLWRRELARPIGIPDASWNWTIVGQVEGTDVNGGGSGMAITARQFARVGHLYLNKGRWAGEQILSENWVEQSTVSQVPVHTPCFQRPDIWYSVMPGRYGYNWWLNGIGKDGKRFWEHAPDGAFFAQGNRNNHCIIVPEWNMVIVHLDEGQAIDSRSYNQMFEILAKAVGQ